jgi:hypothetical protein
MGNGEFYEQAIVPEHLTKMTIENLPLDEAFYISPGERDDYEPPAVFVGPDRKLMISRSHAIDMDENSPGNPLERVGIMRVALINTITESLGEYCIADLRFIEWYSLIDTDELSQGVADQEDYMSFVDMVRDAVQVDAFIALDDDEINVDKKMPDGTFYGPSELHDSLKQLQKRSNKIMKRFMRQRVRIIPKDSVNTTKPGDKTANPEQPKKPAQDLSVKFSPPSS